MSDHLYRPANAVSPRLPRAPEPLDQRRGNVLPFRHRGPAVRYRRRHPLLRMAGPLGLALLLVGVPVSAALWLATTPRLALASISVESEPSVVGTADSSASTAALPRERRVSEAWVQRSLRPLLGTNLLRLHLDAATRAVGGHPWVASVETRKQLPHRLHIRVRERAVAALFDDGEQLLYVDPSGALIAPLGPTDPPADLVVLSRARKAQAPGKGARDAGGAAPSRAADDARRRAIAGGLGIIHELSAVRPEWAARLSEIVILGMEDYRLVIETLPFPLLVRAGTLAGRVRKLESLVPQIAARYGSVAAVDLRFARRIIVQPAESDSFVRS